MRTFQSENMGSTGKCAEHSSLVYSVLASCASLLSFFSLPCHIHTHYFVGQDSLPQPLQDSTLASNMSSQHQVYQLSGSLKCHAVVATGTSQSLDKLNVFWHDSDTFAMECGQICTFKGPSKRCFRCLLISKHCRPLVSKVFILRCTIGNLPDQPPKRLISHQQIC